MITFFHNDFQILNIAKNDKVIKVLKLTRLRKHPVCTYSSYSNFSIPSRCIARTPDVHQKIKSTHLCQKSFSQRLNNYCLLQTTKIMILIFMPYGLFILVFFFLINKHFLNIFNGRFTKERRKKKIKGAVDLFLGGRG